MLMSDIIVMVHFFYMIFIIFGCIYKLFNMVLFLYILLPILLLKY